MVNEEQVIHPGHYNHAGRAECWDEMVDISPIGTALFDLWSAYKYSYRAGTKSGNPEEQDIAKIRAYIKHAEDIHSQVQFPQQCEQIYQSMFVKLSRFY